VMRSFERAIMLHAVDVAWKDHLLALDHLKEGIGLRGYGQRDPLQEYKKESFDLFDMMRERVENDIIQKLWRYEPVTEEQMVEQRVRQQRTAPRIELSAPPKAEGQRPQAATVHREGKVGRNDPCPCGSGKKYKKCHGAAVTVG
jgi:preprotein translocase subunit SecA